MAHEHCNKCFLVNCLHISSCPLIYCPNGCFARMHECKRQDHEYICSNAFISCLNVNYGCPSIIRRSDLSRHLRICPASITVCSFMYHHEYYLNNLENSTNKNLIEIIAYRDNIWHEHIMAFQNKQQQIYSNLRNKKLKNTQIEHIIRSEKYRYITMPECVLSRSDGVICSTCRKHLRQLEENEDQRLSELSEEERKQMIDFNLNYDISSDKILVPSLVKMSSTLVNSSDISKLSSSNSLTTNSITESVENNSMSIISDMELPTSFIYRLNYFSSNTHYKPLTSFNKRPVFYCHALCRRDEIEQHWHIHFRIDCILNLSLIQQCPKSQYGCKFQYERLEPCQFNGQSIQIRFDQMNDAIAFDWYPNINEDYNNELDFFRLPSEILTNILLKLDSLSLRNISLVCRRLRDLCQDLLPSRGIVVTEHERNILSHGDVTWIERQKHWLFTNTSSAVPKWQLKTPNKSTSLTQHLITCPYGETKDLQNEPPFALIEWNKANSIMIMSRLLLKRISRSESSRFLSSLTSFEVKPEQKTQELFDKIIRVDHAGELAADRIYAGQMAILGRTDVGPTIQHMWDEEKAHLAKFNELIPKYKARPSVLLPLWNVAGYALGAGTALLGKEAAMACTVAVEAVISEHYNDQLRDLMEHADHTKDKELMETIKKFRDDETQHLDTGLANKAEQAPFYQGLTSVIKMGCRFGIYIAERI
ncbi:unnamed protein product [Rotaria sp. Silwood1]|nr:unnamed protein product [Rotaria sp. Silwood1]CAF4885715.1 unnamed protein product [Rotaria sp. Silwood1]